MFITDQVTIKLKMKKLINLKVFSVLLFHDEQLDVNGIKFIQPQSYNGFSQTNILKLS
jgi:hypothetical protein